MPILQRELSAFAQHLEIEDRSPGTVGKYLHDASAFAAWLGSRELDQGAAAVAAQPELLTAGHPVDLLPEGPVCGGVKVEAAYAVGPVFPVLVWGGHGPEAAAQGGQVPGGELVLPFMAKFHSGRHLLSSLADRESVPPVAEMTLKNL